MRDRCGGYVNWSLLREKQHKTDGWMDGWISRLLYYYYMLIVSFVFNCFSSMAAFESVSMFFFYFHSPIVLFSFFLIKFLWSVCVQIPNRHSKYYFTHHQHHQHSLLLFIICIDACLIYCCPKSYNYLVAKPFLRPIHSHQQSPLIE